MFLFYFERSFRFRDNQILTLLCHDVIICLSMKKRNTFYWITWEANNECTNLASLAFSLFQNNFFSFLIHFWTFSFSTFQLSVFKLSLPNFLDFAEKLFCLAQAETIQLDRIFLFYVVQSSQVRSGKSICQLPYYSW